MHSFVITFPQPRIWVRNAVIGAALVSYQALIELISAPANRSNETIFLALIIAGAVGGLGFTALTPLRTTSRAGRYVAWVLAVYIVLAAVLLPFIVAHDDVVTNMFRLPIGWFFWLLAGAVTGIFCARAAARWTKGDYR